ncbi:MAG: ABC transporter ATP-binding protein/permease [Firmicutes bacterium]|uniref:ABC transporter ATP-binding protein/permease n=1 Tax=Candidatus Colimorpha enterica TaxID=3083063 RepID=A0AAE3FHQ4_9BACT|nr:ABC transporter ATP-binding protein/permease [Candidatus Colimorpha enterica]
MKKKLSSAGLKKSLAYVSHYKPLIVLTLTLAVVSTAAALIVPVIIGDTIDLIIGKDNVSIAGVVSGLSKAAIIFCIGGIAQWLMAMINNKITFSVVRDIRRDAFEKIQRLPISYIDSHPHGDIVSRIIADVDQFSDGLLMGFTQLFTGVLTIAATLVFMFAIQPVIAAVVVVLTPMSLFIANFIAKKTYGFFREQSAIRGEQTDYINEMVENVKTVKAFSNEDRVIGKFSEINGRLEKSSLRAIFFSSLTNPTTRFVNAVVYAAVAGAGAIAVIGGGLTVGGLSVFLSYVNQYTKPFNEISGVLAELQNALACAERIFDFISAESEKPDAPDALVLDGVKGSVGANDVSFSYVPDRKLIEHFNLDVKPGQKIAIVGPTGCGKTTFINLLMRFYDVNSGSITVDGHDIRDITRKSLRLSYGMVLQETWLKHGTVRENLKLGRPYATDGEMIDAAKKTHCHGFISRLENGYDTVISESGGNLSNGQKQLLCIARAMISDPPMLILDEATSSIDTRTEIRVQNAMKKLMGTRTSFVVAHRLSTIMEMDLILVMKDGNIIEQGTHGELMAKGGFYSVLFNSQFAE